MACDPDIALWNQKSFEFLHTLSPWEQELYIFASNNGFDAIEYLEQGFSLTDALDIFIEAAGISFGC